MATHHTTRGGWRSHARAVARSVCALLLVGILPAAIPKNQLECEEAIAHLSECCPGLEASQVCGDGCSPITLSEGESECIVDRDCESLRAARVCERVEALSKSANAVDAGPIQAVCP